MKPYTSFALNHPPQSLLSWKMVVSIFSPGGHARSSSAGLYLFNFTFHFIWIVTVLSVPSHLSFSKIFFFFFHGWYDKVYIFLVFLSKTHLGFLPCRTWLWVSAIHHHLIPFSHLGLLQMSHFSFSLCENFQSFSSQERYGCCWIVITTRLVFLELWIPWSAVLPNRIMIWGMMFHGLMALNNGLFMDICNWMLMRLFS